MNFNNNQTSAQDPSKVSTYVSGDSYYDKTDFPGMKGNTNFDVQANIQFSNGKYYPFLYISDGKTPPKVKQLDGDENLENLLLTLQSVNPTIVKKLIIMPN